jgi:hypothetical protein
MTRTEIKELIIKSLSSDLSSEESWKKLKEAGVNYSFGENFSTKVLDRIFSTGITVNREIEFIRSMNFAFYRVALTGIAAIVILLISIFLMEGSLSFNSFIGLSNGYDESIVCLLTGN